MWPFKSHLIVESVSVSQLSLTVVPADTVALTGAVGCISALLVRPVNSTTTPDASSLSPSCHVWMFGLDIGTWRLSRHIKCDILHCTVHVVIGSKYLLKMRQCKLINKILSKPDKLYKASFFIKSECKISTKITYVDIKYSINYLNNYCDVPITVFKLRHVGLIVPLIENLKRRNCRKKITCISTNTWGVEFIVVDVIGSADIIDNYVTHIAALTRSLLVNPTFSGFAPWTARSDLARYIFCSTSLCKLVV